MEKNFTPFKKSVLGEKINEGSHADIHNICIGDKKYVAKIGKTTEYTPPILKSLKIAFPREKFSNFLEKIVGPEFKISPDMDFIKNGLAEYMLMKKYFGFANDKEVDEISKENQEIRQELIKELNDQSSNLYREIKKILKDDELISGLVMAMEKNAQVNFLNKEWVIAGHPPSLSKTKAKDILSEGGKLPQTYYIIQEKVEGENIVPLSSMRDEELIQHPELLEKLLAFAVITKKMYYDTGKLIDLRPEEIAKHPFEWFQKTANILIDKDKDALTFVDTRWLWDKDSKLGKGGVNLIELFGVRSINKAIKKYAELLCNKE